MIRNKSLFFGYIIGTILEWYDFALFGTLAALLSTLFFPSSNQLASLLAVFGAFAAGFIMRPIGALLFSHWGDALSRNKAAIISIFVMTIPTVLIGVLPTYQQCGVFASIALVIMRMLQGLSAGGEYSGVIVILWEMADKQEKSFISSLSISGVTLGMVLGSVVSFIATAFMSQKILYSWGWRLPFLFSIILGIVGFYLRLGANKSELLKQNFPDKPPKKRPLITLVKQYKKNTVLAIGLFMVNVVFFYTVFIYYPAYLIKVHRFSTQIVLLVSSTNMLLAIFFLPLVGKISDKTNKYFVMVLGAITFIICAYPLFLLFAKPSIVSMFTGQMLLTLLSILFIASVPAVATGLFPAEVKYSGISIGLNIAAIFFGGLAPLISAFLVYVTKNTNSPMFFVIFAFSVGLICVSCCKNKINADMSL